MFPLEFIQMSTQPWEIDTRHLEALIAIARTRSISRAAVELGYGQSTVSQQLAVLERTVGRRLVDRGTGPRPVSLTAAGEILLGHANWIIARLGLARDDLSRLDDGATGSIRIGTFQSAGASLLPQVLADYRSAWPSISVSLHNENRDGDLAGLLLRGSLDVAFVERSWVTDGLAHVELLIDDYVALVPPGHRLATRTTLSLADLADEDLIDGGPNDTCTARATQAFRALGSEPRIVFRTDDNPTRQRIVNAGLGCAVVPRLTVEAGLPDGGVVVALESELHRVICLAWPTERTSSFAVERFIATAQERFPARSCSAS